MLQFPLGAQSIFSGVVSRMAKAKLAAAMTRMPIAAIIFFFIFTAPFYRIVFNWFLFVMISEYFSKLRFSVQYSAWCIKDKNNCLNHKEFGFTQP